MTTVAKKFIVPTEDSSQSMSDKSHEVNRQVGETIVKQKAERKTTASERLAELELKVITQRRMMNMAKTVAPIVCAIIANPGSAAPVKDKADAINRMVSLAAKSATNMMEQAAPDLSGKGWAQAGAFEVCAKVLSAEWQKTGSCEAAESVLTPEFFMSLSKTLEGEDERSLLWLEQSGVPAIKNESDAATRIRMSLLKGFAPLMMDIQSFSFWKSAISNQAVEDFSADMMDRIAEVSARSANLMADENGINDLDRIMLWQNTIKRAFAFAQEEYRADAQRAFGEIDACKTPSERSSVRRQWATNYSPMQLASKVDYSLTLMNKIVSRYVTEAFDSDAKSSTSVKMK